MEQRIIRAFFLRSGHLKSQFSTSKCVLPISVGQEYHEGEKFKATIKLVNDHFNECLIIVCDSLQRHTIPLYTHEVNELPYNQALKAGDGWLKNSQSYLDQLRINYKIMRWDDWLNHKNYSYNKKIIETLYMNDERFNFAVNSTVEYFTERFRAKNPDAIVDDKEAFNLCLNYIKEECSVMPLWEEEKVNFELYPSKQNNALSLAREYLVKPFYDNILQYVQLNFRTRQLLPQNSNHFDMEESFKPKFVDKAPALVEI